ncbi:hypothetical protein M758_10G088000 [Ceratodon purpureus]|nr:hypothetical protein M758_10G088000 [Ceratodon purpureus]
MHKTLISPANCSRSSSEKKSSHSERLSNYTLISIKRMSWYVKHGHNLRVPPTRDIYRAPVGGQTKRGKQLGLSYYMRLDVLANFEERPVIHVFALYYCSTSRHCYAFCTVNGIYG